MFFQVFCLFQRILLLDLVSLGSAKVYIGWGGKLNCHLMASCVRNIPTKHYQNLFTDFKLQSKMSGMFFFGTQCTLKIYANGSNYSKKCLIWSPLFFKLTIIYI